MLASSLLLPIAARTVRPGVSACADHHADMTGAQKALSLSEAGCRLERE